MEDWNLPWEGGCRCGQVRLRITAPPLITTACHCRGCQRMTASAYSLSVGVPATGFSVTQGEPVIGGLHTQHRQYYCPRCKSWLFTRPHGYDWFVNVRSAMRDDLSWYVPFAETFTSEMLPWAKTPALHRFPRFPEEEDWQPLVQQFSLAALRELRAR